MERTRPAWEETLQAWSFVNHLFAAKSRRYARMARWSGNPPSQGQTARKHQTRKPGYMRKTIGRPGSGLFCKEDCARTGTGSHKARWRSPASPEICFRLATIGPRCRLDGVFTTRH